MLGVTMEMATETFAEPKLPLATATELHVKELSETRVASEVPREPKEHLRGMMGVMLAVLTVTDSPPSVLTEPGEVESVAGHAPV